MLGFIVYILSNYLFYLSKVQAVAQKDPNVVRLYRHIHGLDNKCAVLTLVDGKIS